jgi:hypothetical protein
VLAAVVLAVLVVVAGVSHRGGAIGAVVLAAVSVLWLLVNGPMEGEILVQVTSMNGLTGGDLAGLAGLALAGARLWQVVRTRRQR